MLGANAIDVTGQRVGRLTVVSVLGRDKNRNVLWRAVCDCGGETSITTRDVRNGHIQSCGCRRREATVRRNIANALHGHTAAGKPSRTFSSWQAMMTRCFNLNHEAHTRYAGRGITVCDRWKTFANFLADMGERPADRTLDRIDNDRGYEPGNCRWATKSEQNKNKRPRYSVSARAA